MSVTFPRACQFSSALSTQHSALPARRLFLGLFAAAALLAGCGYQFQVEGPGPTIGGKKGAAPLSPNAPTISVAIFQNLSVEPNLELKFTEYTRREFLSGSGARLVNEAAHPDLVFKGSIMAVIVPTLTFQLTRTLETRVTVYVQSALEKTKTKEIIWSHLSTASSEFFVTQDLQFNRLLQRRALEQAGIFVAQDVAARVMNHLDTYGLEPAPQGTGPEIPAGMQPGMGGGRR